MGACDFMNRSCGKNARDAFDSLRDHAAYEHGHGGYTGTIAEKGSFVELPTPKTKMDMEELAECANNEGKTYTVWRELKEGEASPFWGCRTTYNDDGTKTTFVPEQREIPDDLKAWMKRAVDVANDKWGPAACVEVTGKAAKDYREQVGMKGKRGIKVFLFFGWASS